MKKIAKYFLVTFISVFAMFFIMQTNVRANYDPDKNYANISVSKNGITIDVTYQRGFSGKNDNKSAYYVWCELTSTYRGNDICETGTKVYFNDEDVIVKGSSSYADSNPSSKTFFIDKDKDPNFKLENVNSLANKEYRIFVVLHYCSIRDEKNYNDEFTRCIRWNEAKSLTYIDVKGSELAYNASYSIKSDIGDEKINNLMTQITEIVYDIVLPAIWVLLGIFFVVKGAILGVQIVKSADDPEIRKNKLGSLKWLVLGVAIAYGATGVIKALERIIKDLVGVGD